MLRDSLALNISYLESFSLLTSDLDEDQKLEKKRIQILGRSRGQIQSRLPICHSRGAEDYGPAREAFWNFEPRPCLAGWNRVAQAANSLLITL